MPSLGKQVAMNRTSRQKPKRRRAKVRRRSVATSGSQNAASVANLSPRRRGLRQILADLRQELTRAVITTQVRRRLGHLP
jgi:hypothetical protein